MRVSFISATPEPEALAPGDVRRVGEFAVIWLGSVWIKSSRKAHSSEETYAPSVTLAGARKATKPAGIRAVTAW